MKSITRKINPNVELDDIGQDYAEENEGFRMNEDSFEGNYDSFKRVGRFQTFVNLANALIGAGIINVPATFIPCGLGPTIVMIMFVCFMCFVCGNTLINLQHETNIVGLDDLAFRVFGRYGEIFTNVLTLIFTFSYTSAYLIIGSDQIVEWLTYIKVSISSLGNWALVVIVYSLSLPVALTIPRHLSFLSILSIPITICILFVSISLFIRSSINLAAPGGLSTTANGYSYHPNAFLSFSIHLSTFALPILQLPILRYYNPSVEKRQSITGLTYLFTFFLVALPSGLIYLNFGDKTQSDVLNSYLQKDTYMIFLQILLFLIVSCTYPFITNNIISFFSGYIFQEPRQEKLPTLKRSALIILVNIINIIIAMVLRDNAPVLAFGGSIGGCLICFVFPSLCRLKTMRNTSISFLFIFHIIITLFGLATFAICTYYSVKNAISVFRNPG